MGINTPLGMAAKRGPRRLGTMIKGLQRNWRELKESAPGHRFQERYARRQRAKRRRWDAKSLVNIALGLAVALGGLFLIPAPGPGWAITFLGLGLLGSEFSVIARFLDQVELKVRAVARWVKRTWNGSPFIGQALLVLVALLLMAALGYGAYVWLLK
jgi:uncharacterized protein (TIGR02611 family)